MSGCWKKCTGLPFSVVPIVLNELCERWCFYSIRAVLILYLTGPLLFSADDAVSVYSFWIAASYFAPLVGGYVSDVWLGKYRTILLFNIIFYLAGLAVLAGTAFFASRAGAFIGLFLMALGTGGIKPCVSAFGADQLTSGSEHESTRFFLVFYAAINIGSTLSFIVTPLVRVAYGYQWAFLLSLAVLSLSIVAFVAGQRTYMIVPPVGRSFYGKCLRVLHAAQCGGKNGRAPPSPSSSSSPAAAASSDLESLPLMSAESSASAPLAGAAKASGGASGAALAAASGDGAVRGTAADGDSGLLCLDRALRTQPRADIIGVAAVLNILPLFLCTTMFWALFDTQASVWTLQRESMGVVCFGGAGVACLTVEQLGALNPIFVVLIVPLMACAIESLRKCAARGSAARRHWIEPTPLRRMTCGMFITAAAFALTAEVQARIDASPPRAVSSLWQVPQFFVMTVAEVLVSATGLEWAYTQAPVSMRSSVVALYLSMVAIGNVFTGILYAALASVLSSLQIMLTLMSLMLVAALAFTALAARYRPSVVAAAAAVAAAGSGDSRAGGAAMRDAKPNAATDDDESGN